MSHCGSACIPGCIGAPARGGAAQPGSQVISASDLIVYVRSQVGSNPASHQTPDFGTLPGHESGGEFLLVLPVTADRDTEEPVGESLLASPATVERDTEEPVADLSEWVTIRTTKEYEVAAVAIVTAMETCLAQRGIRVELSPDQLYGRAKEHDGKASVGGTWLKPLVYIADFFGVDVKGGSAPGEGRTTYHARFYWLASLEEFPSHLNMGRPSVAQCRVYDSWFPNKTGEITVPSEKEQLVGYAAITVVKYDPNDGSLVFAANWGEEWGNKGFGFMSKEAAQAYLVPDQMWAVEVRG